MLFIISVLFCISQCVEKVFLRLIIYLKCELPANISNAKYLNDIEKMIMKYKMRVRRLFWNNRRHIISNISAENFIWRELKGRVNNFPQINFPAWTSKTFYLIYLVIISHPTMLKPTYIHTTSSLCRLITILCWFFLQLDFALRNIRLSSVS